MSSRVHASRVPGGQRRGGGIPDETIERSGARLDAGSNAGVDRPPAIGRLASPSELRELLAEVDPPGRAALAERLQAEAGNRAVGRLAVESDDVSISPAPHLWPEARDARGTGGMAATGSLRVQRQGIQTAPSEAASSTADLVAFSLQVLASVASQRQLDLAQAALARKVPAIHALLGANPGHGVLVITVMKMPDPDRFDPAVRGQISASFVGVFLRDAPTYEEAMAEADLLEDPDYVYECAYAWYPPVPAV